MENTAHQNISTHDKAVLSRIFNPNLPYGDVCDEAGPIEPVAEEPISSAVVEAKKLEVEGVKQAEAGHAERALELFNQAISIAPEHASAYNNRAQALRLQGDIQGAMQDLNKAIELSHGQGKVACQSYTQRGLIKRLEGDEDSAKEDLRNAANLGGQFAKHLLISLNPYAALCNQMLSEVMCRMKNGDQPVD